jgi:chemotaxis protein CheX
MNRSEQIKLSCEVLENYFREIANEKVEFGVPYEKENNFETLNLSGAIGISGTYVGCIYFTAEEKMINELAKIITMSDEIDLASIYDMIGELTNTIAGNLRKSFGSEFEISIPIIIRGSSLDIIINKLKAPVIVIPVKWRNYKFYFNIGIR